MTKYRVIFDDPDALDEPTKVLVPSQNWIDEAMAGKLPPIWVYWQRLNVTPEIHWLIDVFA